MIAKRIRQTLERDASWFSAVDTIPPPGYSRGTAAGQLVSPMGGLALPAVGKAVRTISESAGAMPLVTYRKLNPGRTPATTHPAYGLLLDRPNPEETASEAWTRVFAHLAGWGESFIGKGRTLGQVTSLWPIHPGNMEVRRRDGRIIYLEHITDARGQISGQKREWAYADLIHVKLFSLDGICGISPLGLYRETLGLGLAMQRHASQFFGEGGVPSGTLSVEGRIRDPAVKEAMREEWKERHSGTREIAILEEGAKYEAITVPMEDAQFVQQHGLNVTDIANIFNMPASMLNGSTGDTFTYGNRESDAQNFLTFTLANPLRKVEQALGNDPELFPKTNTFASEFNRDSILAPLSLDRARFYTMALGDAGHPGWLDRDEVREMENRPAADGAAPPPAAVPAPASREEPAEPPPEATNGDGRESEERSPVDEVMRSLDIAEAIASVSGG